MADSIELEGKEYISSKRAARSCAYTQDYVGQLARAGHIDARRVSGLWYVHLESLQAYKTNAEAYKPEPPKRYQFAGSDPESLISFDGKDYISASRASRLTGYNVDYIGQLARAATVPARQVSNRWYVEREAILAHKREKDALLAAVQAQSVGVVSGPSVPQSERHVNAQDATLYQYKTEQGDLIPSFAESEKVPAGGISPNQFERPVEAGNMPDDEPISVPIQIRSGSVPTRRPSASYVPVPSAPRPHTFSRSSVMITLAVVLFVGLPLSMYLGSASGSSTQQGATHTSSFFGSIASFFEGLVTHDLTYIRPRS